MQVNPRIFVENCIVADILDELSAPEIWVTIQEMT